MRKIRFICAIAICFFITITALFAYHLTGTMPKGKLKASAIITNPIPQKKKCPCYSPKIEKAIKDLEQEIIK